MRCVAKLLDRMVRMKRIAGSDALPKPSSMRYTCADVDRRGNAQGPSPLARNIGRSAARAARLKPRGSPVTVSTIG